MCNIVLRQFLIVSVLFIIRDVNLTRVVDLTRISCVEWCKVPQPRSIVLAKEIQSMDDVLPQMATLYRCDEGSGCCNTKNKICQVANWEILKATIYVKDITTKKYVPKVFEISNHTACSCQSPKNTPK